MYIYPNEAKLSSPLIFDSHAHIDDNAFEGILDTLVPDMASNGVAGIVCCGCNEASSKKTLEIAEEYDLDIIDVYQDWYAWGTVSMTQV